MCLECEAVGNEEQSWGRGSKTSLVSALLREGGRDVPRAVGTGSRGDTAEGPCQQRPEAPAQGAARAAGLCSVLNCSPCHSTAGGPGTPPLQQCPGSLALAAAASGTSLACLSASVSGAEFTPLSLPLSGWSAAPTLFSLSLGLDGGCSTGNLTPSVPNPRVVQDIPAFPLMRSFVLAGRGIPRSALHPDRQEDASSASLAQTSGSLEHTTYCHGVISRAS